MLRQPHHFKNLAPRQLAAVTGGDATLGQDWLCAGTGQDSAPATGKTLTAALLGSPLR